MRPAGGHFSNLYYTMRPAGGHFCQGHTSLCYIADYMLYSNLIIAI